MQPFFVNFIKNVIILLKFHPQSQKNLRSNNELFRSQIAYTLKTNLVAAIVVATGIFFLMVANDVANDIKAKKIQ